MSTMSLAEATAQLTAPGQLFEMEEVVIRGIPTRVWKHAPDSLRTVLELSRGHGDKDFLVYEDERTTFEEHFRQAAALAQLLRDRFGVQKGDRVALVMRNLPEWALTFWAAAAAGAIVVPVNAWWKGDELEYALADSGSSVAVVDSERHERLLAHYQNLPQLRAVVVADEQRSGQPPTPVPGVETVAFADIRTTPGGDVQLPDVPLAPDDDATIFYTSGTTGRPKGVVGTHRNMCTNLMSLFFLNTRAQLRRAGEVADVSEGGQNAYLLSVPLFHATGCHSILVANTAAGGKLVMMHHFDPERALELIERERITTFGGVPAMVMQILDSPDFAKRDTSSVRAVAYGGAPAPPELVRRIKQHFPSGSPSNGYGLTETSSVTTMNMGDDYVRKPDSVGPPVPVCDVAVVPEHFEGDEPTEDLPRGPQVVGELWVKGPNVVRGYWNKPEETARTFTKGWLHTGDIARIDEEGFVYIVDRAKDLVIRGGENISSVEVESVLFEHPAVADCAVIGVPHPVLGEEVGAVVVLRPGAQVTAEELTRHVKERLAAFKAPAHIWFRSEPLPRNPQGKVLKRELRTELVEQSST
ncbi:class I adenylate-forming enzyme family protein [Aciditerrimonas ferrireducens]|uniref:Class I adenylate-forming enzyme family protein n=1 Tax=Aciditerrimonas ferrireducens TaxID=667306 RepID=A0ABV6C4S1_9ACTN